MRNVEIQKIDRIFGGIFSYRTEDYGLEDIKINDHNGVCLNLSDKERFGARVVWDNDDYILEIDGNLPKDGLLELAKSAKVLEN